MNLDSYTYIETRGKYKIYRKIVNGKGKWAAQRNDGVAFKITYSQALGYEPIDDIEALRMHLGRMLLPR